MAVDPEIVGTVIGSAIVAIGFGGKYIHTKYSATTKKDNGNGDSPILRRTSPHGRVGHKTVRRSQGWIR